MKIFTLGPEGSFSEIASKKFLSNFKKEAQINFCNSISDVFETISKKNKKEFFGVIPVENMIDGSVGESLDLLYNFSSINIISEVIIPINLCLASKYPIKNISRVISHPKAIGQCRKYISKKGFDTENELSTSNAMKKVSENNFEKDLAAIGTKEAAKYYGLNILKENLEDNKNNLTRFFVISTSSKEVLNSRSSFKQFKDVKTSLAIHPTVDKPGLLLRILEPFSKRNINLTKIESRPTKLNLGEYIFYIDFNKDSHDKDVKNVLKEIRGLGDIRILGSYFKLK